MTRYDRGPSVANIAADDPRSLVDTPWGIATTAELGPLAATSACPARVKQLAEHRVVRGPEPGDNRRDQVPVDRLAGASARLRPWRRRRPVPSPLARSSARCKRPWSRVWRGQPAVPCRKRQATALARTSAAPSPSGRRSRTRGHGRGEAGELTGGGGTDWERICHAGVISWAVRRMRIIFSSGRMQRGPRAADSFCG